ncbi:hypothetical protein OVA29_04425 [Exiguobacterium sp. SL14]|nr:hypothetical protein [Exiguobacterium sp. SL14]MCY1690150.1 hypothetical protein [Exiguobacterium sp. SL14]
MAGIRLSGLASGIDTETMIKQLMQAERALGRSVIAKETDIDLAT